ncbi:MAG: inositol monophosphatase family protein [Nakamurella sp.]
MTQTSEDLIPELLELAVRAARAAGAELLSRYGNVQGLDSKTSATDPVSDADRAAETVLVDLISAQRPDDGLLGEEGASRESTSGITWVIDPLDGTVNYLYELDTFSVSVAARDHADAVLVGVVYEPARDVIYTAARGRGAHKNGVVLHVSDAVPAARALLGTGFSYEQERRRRQGALIAAMLPEVRDIRRIGSAALDLCFVASGALDAYYEEGTHPWDVSAGGLIVTEAGGTFAECAPLGVASGKLAAAPGLFEELFRLLHEHSER